MRLRREEVPPIYPLTQSQAGMTLEQLVSELVAAGARWIQVREKSASDLRRYHELRAIAASLPSLVRLFVNDRTDLALACQADGVHLGDQDLPVEEARRIAGEELLIGYSTHSVDEALEAAARPEIDYVAIGPIFRSSTKDVRSPLGTRPIEQIRMGTDKPLVAIGGIDAGNVADVLRAGADSAAIIGALYAEGSIREAVSRLHDAAERAR
jgi:thiamine-phosphate pyrophosphorylase